MSTSQIEDGAMPALLVGTHIKVVSERLGHASPAFTMTVYQHLLPSMQRDAIDAIAALVSEAG